MTIHKAGHIKKLIRDKWLDVEYWIHGASEDYLRQVRRATILDRWR